MTARARVRFHRTPPVSATLLWDTRPAPVSRTTCARKGAPRQSAPVTRADANRQPRQGFEGAAGTRQPKLSRPSRVTTDKAYGPSA